MYAAHNSPVDVVEYQNLQKASGEHLDPVHPQHLVNNSSNLRRVMPDEMATRPKNDCELRFSSLHSIGDIRPGQRQPKYSDKPNVESDSRLARTRFLFPGEWSRSEE